LKLSGFLHRINIDGDPLVFNVLLCWNL